MSPPRAIKRGRRFTRIEGEEWKDRARITHRVFAPDPREPFDAARIRAEAQRELRRAGLHPEAIESPHVVENARLALLHARGAFDDPGMIESDDAPPLMAARALLHLRALERLLQSAEDAAPAAAAALGFAIGRCATLLHAYGGQIRDQATAAARAERPGARDAVRRALVAALREHRRAGRTLAEALEALVRSGSPAAIGRIRKASAQHGLSVAREGAGVVVTGCGRRRVFANRTVETLWTEAGTARPKTARARD